MKPDTPIASAPPPPIRSYDGPLGRRIIETHIWAVREGLRAATAYELFDGYCQRLVIDGVPLWRGHAAMETLHPQWSGYGYTWRRDLNAIQSEQYDRSETTGEEWLKSPMYDLIRRAHTGEDNPWMRRRLEEGPQQRDFPVLEKFFAQGATDYFGQVFTFFDDDDTALMQATLPALSLAMKAHAGHVIASALLRTYLGEETGRRVHAGAIERGTCESIHAVLWYADIRGFTPASDTAPGAVIIDLLDNVFEALTAALRSRGGEVLKFLGDGMLATLPFAEAERAATCRRALDAAADATRGLAELNATRAEAGLPAVTVDLALHVGDVLYGNVGAADRLDFTVIGPAVNEVARIETLCESLGQAVLASAEFAAAVEDGGGRLVSLGRYNLRGVREAKEIFALSDQSIAAGS